MVKFYDKRNPIACMAWTWTLYLLFSGCSFQALKPKFNHSLTRHDVEYINRQMQKEIEVEYRLISHRQINRYLNGLGQKMVARNTSLPVLPYEFRVLKSGEVNIFSLPGGLVYVTLGVFIHFENESQLAAAIAHELAHQYAGHHITAWRKRLKKEDGNFYFSDEKYASWEAKYLGESGFLYFGEKVELEADAISPVLLYHARIDPRAYLDYLYFLKKNATKNPEIFKRLLMVHPSVSERIEKTIAQLTNIPPLKKEKFSNNHFLAIQRKLKRLNRN